MKKVSVFASLLILLFVFTNCASTGSAGQITSGTIRDFVCRVSINFHPSVDEYLRSLVNVSLNMGSEDGDTLARHFSIRRGGGSGSGFVYVDDKGNNFIITNHHVIAQAYTYTVTFEDENNNIKRQFKNLTVFGYDRENDLAILQFPNGERPFKRGLPIIAKDAQDLDPVFSAGYPGMPIEQRWRIAPGTITSAKHEFDKKFIILHNANTDPGNSGGPLLAADPRSPAGYAVQGVIYAHFRNPNSRERYDGGNMAVPSTTLLKFLDLTFEEKKLNDEEQIKRRVNAFVTMLNNELNNEALLDLPIFMSPAMLADNPNITLEVCRSELGSMSLTNPELAQLRRSIEEISINNPPWAIELATTLVRIVLPAIKAISADTRNQGIRAVKTETNNFGGYTVFFNIGGYPFRSEWVKINGTWTINSFHFDDGEFNNAPEYASWHPKDLYVNYEFSSSRDIDCYIVDELREGRLVIRTESAVNVILEVLHNDRRLPVTETITGRDRVTRKEFVVTVPSGAVTIVVGTNSQGVTNVPYSILVTQQ
ncbi:MAG: serine protease [Treponema sp.]|nr:serine protease [Treponema sp.]